ncbi:MAG: MDR/zinc-dependent alcohol dehydrogenase-like family protein [Bacteroidales bacterium]
MKAAIIQSPGQIEVADVPVPEPNADEVLVKLDGCGLCVSNLPVWEGREWFEYPMEPGAPGHEGYGTVAKTGAAVKDFTTGDKVALISYHAYAEYDKAPAGNVVKLPDEFEGRPFPGEPAGCAVNIFNRSDIQPGHTVVVIGTGYIGCLLIQLIKSTGAKVIAVSRRNSSLVNAGRSGADELVKFVGVNETAGQIGRLFDNGIMRVVEATGAQMAIDLATAIIAERGRMIIAGFHQDGPRSINLQSWNWKGIDVINAHERDPQKYTDGLKMAVEKTKEGILRPHELISHQFNLEDIGKAFQMLHERPEGFLKAVIVNP